MASSPDGSPRAHSVASSVGTQPRLDGALLSLMALVLIGCGTFGGVLFAGVYLIEGAPAGFFEWLATGINTILSLLVFARLLLDRRGYSSQLREGMA